LKILEIILKKIYVYWWWFSPHESFTYFIGFITRIICWM